MDKSKGKIITSPELMKLEIKNGYLVKCNYCNHYVHSGNYCENCGHSLNQVSKKAPDKSPVPKNKPTGYMKITADAVIKEIIRRLKN